MKLLSIAIATIGFFYLCTASLAAEHSPKHKSPSTAGIQLSDTLSTLLKQEMAAVEAGMKKLVHEIAAGNWDEIARIARNIEGSFIMKKKLSNKQKKELKAKLPERFKEMDGEFHKTAGMLAKVADKRHGGLVTFYFYKLTDSCLKCHSRYAKGRFPNFDNNGAGHSHNH